ncbi:hypothetical protein CSKR_107129 [Clonorchis sinensis]|uniref:Protein kinase domain-containing protein n=1 Tax=Clonorchis sinensis TaxID=79923 RepID=A0A8T1MTT9_CLOSI|nr:hypothetical protein CSKR_107129 [Clonorchis sinensis]
MENFVLYDEIGKANDQTIYKARRKGTIKYLAISCAERHTRPYISNHVRFVHVLKHQNVLQFLEWYETSNHLWLVMELCTGGNLEQVVKEDGNLPENVVRKFGADIVRGLEYIHSRGVLFNDMRPSRFLLDGNGNVKLFDFSLAHLENECLEEVLQRFNDEDEFSQASNSLDRQSPSPFTSPETLNSGQVTRLSDYWGLGCLLYYMFCGRPPFGDEDNEQGRSAILYGNFTPPKCSGRSASPQFLSLLNGLLVKSPRKRLSPAQVIHHEFWQFHLQDIDTMSSTTEPVFTEDTSSVSNNQNGQGQPAVLLNGVKNSQEAEKVYIPGELVSTEAREPPVEDRVATDNQRSNLPSLDIPATTMHADAANFTLHAMSNVSPSPSNRAAFGEPESERPAIQDADEQSKTGAWEPSARMVQSEYQRPLSRNEDDVTRTETVRMRKVSIADEAMLGESGGATSDEAKFTPRPVPLATRADLATTYPWGDDSPNLPHEMRLMVSLWSYVQGIHPSESATRKQRLSVGTLNQLSSWRPRPLNDYVRWIRASPPSKVEGLAYVYNEAKLRADPIENIEAHIAEVIALFQSRPSDPNDSSSNRLGRGFSTRSSVRHTKSTLIAYSIWLMASTTSTVSRNQQSTAARHEQFKLCGIAYCPKFLVEITRQLKSNSVTLPIDTRVGLCQLTSLLAHRIANAAFQHTNDDSKPVTRQQELPWNSIMPNLSSCLSSLVETLREPASRTGPRLRQVAAIALGEVVTCAICLVQYSVKETETTGVRDGILSEIQPSQWQTVVHHLTRCLAPTNSGSGSASDGASVLDQFDFAVTDGMGRGNSATDTGGAGFESPSFVRATELHVRLGAARSLDAFVTTILGCQLHDLTVSGSLLAAATACTQAIVTAEVVSQLWTSGMCDPPVSKQISTGINVVHRNQLHQEISLSCSSALAAIVRINPSLFVNGLIERIGATAFTNLLEPPAGGPACQQTSLVVRLLSMAATGLLTPLVNQSTANTSTTKNRRHSGFLSGASLFTRQHSVSSGGGAGTPAACRRLLSDQRFMTAVFRHLKSPHAMLRSKSYLLCSAILTTCPKDSFPLAFDANLPAYLERDLKATRNLQSRYVDTQSMSTAIGSTAEMSGSTSMVYLAACTLHFTDVLVTHLIPLVCQQLLICLGCISPATSTSRQSGGRKQSRPHTILGNPRSNQLPPASSTSCLNTIVAVPNLNVARTWLPAFSCLATLLSTSITVRMRLLVPESMQLCNSSSSSNDEVKRSGFCLLSFLGRMLDLWASVDPISSAVSVAGVHQSGTVESQVLTVTLTITEDLSQLAEVVEAKRREFVCLVLPGLARLAVAPRARPETRAICVKIIANLAQILLGENDTLSSANSMGDIPNVPGSAGTEVTVHPADRPLSADVEVLLKELNAPTIYERAQSVVDLCVDKPEAVMSQSYYPSGSPRNRPKRPDKRAPIAATLGAAVQPPTADVLITLFDIVNRLMIPYADRIVHCPEATAPTAFICLVNRLLTAVPVPNPSAPDTPPHIPTAKGDCAPTQTEPPLSSLQAARTLVSKIGAYGLDVSLIRLLAAQLLTAVELDITSSQNVVKSQGTVASLLCLNLLHLIPLLLRWSKESRPSHLIIDLRLLELIAIACLELGSLLFPHSSVPVDQDEVGTRRTKSSTTGLQSSTKIASKTCSSAPSKRTPRKPLTGQTYSASTQLHVSMLAGLEAMNALLNHVANVVRIALAARATNTSEGETAAMAAEEILAASRPPPALAGLLARLIGLWRPRPPPEGDSSEACAAETSMDEDACFQLCEAAITSLTNFASLYGGEHSRSALTPSAAASLSLCLLRLAGEDRRLQEERTSTCSTYSPRAPSTPDTNRSTPQARRRMRLLLRIIRRLVSSDPVCSSRLAAEALETGTTNLYTTLVFLLHRTQRYADATTAKLLREIINFVSSKTRVGAETNGMANARSEAASHKSSMCNGNSHQSSAAVA